jgi:hypothetical protein
MGSVVVRAFWGPRPQAVEDGVAAIIATLTGLRELDESRYSRWFALGGSKREALGREIATVPAAVTAALSQNREGGRVFGELGYSFGAWNGAGRDEDTVSFSVSFSVTSPRVTNRVVFGLPPEWEHDLDRARQALGLVVRVWRPERASVRNAERVDLLVAEL